MNVQIYISKELQEQVESYFNNRLFELNEKYGETHGWLDYTFRWNRRSSSLGICNYQMKRIEVSAKMAKHMTFGAIKDTINHEFAHAYAGWKADHGEIWQEWAKELGATPKEKAETGEVQKKYCYLVDGKVVGYTNVERTPEELKSIYMVGCKRQTLGRMVQVENVNYIDNRG